MMLPRTLGLLTFLLALLGAAGTPQAQPESLIGAKAVTSVSYDEVRQALADAGVVEVGDRTADANFPSFGGSHSQGASLQATLYACDAAEQRCRGVELISLIEATTLRNAQIIVGSIERSAFSIDAKVFEIQNRPGAVAVMITSYLVYDHGVSDQLLTIALEQFFSVVGQTKGFMLKDDPAHAELWARKEP
jgi:hypothetical protein